MSVVVRMDLELHQLDIKTAFLNGELKEDIYMLKPEGFEMQNYYIWIKRTTWRKYSRNLIWLNLRL